MQRQSVSITHEEIEEAIARFRARGGMIRKLPDEVVLPAASVSCEGAQAFAVAEVAGQDRAPVKSA